MFLFRRKKKEDEKEYIHSLTSMIEFTLLDPRAITKDIYTLINVAIKNGYYGVCVNPEKVYEARQYINNQAKVNTALISVVGFPLGINSIQTKVVEAKQVFSDGADEVDVVINISKAKEGDYGYIKNEMSRIVRIAKGKIVKAIIETCYLTREEIKQVCKACLKAKVDFIKTSTGYGVGGANAEDISTIREVVQGKCGIKASGGIKTKMQAEEMIRAGATRIGTSRVI